MYTAGDTIIFLKVDSDALRMELSDTGVDVLSVCPGPVDSNIGDNTLLTELSTMSAGVIHMYVYNYLSHAVH